MIKITKIVSIAAASLLLISPVFAASDARDKAIELAKAGLNRQMGVAETQIRLVQAQAAEWPDSSLGCAQKGMLYQPVITPGHVVKIATDTQSYTVHVGAGRAVVCDQGSGAPRDRSVGRNQHVLNLVQMAREDLRNSLGDSQAPVRVARVTPTNWPDGSLGCPMPGMSYAQVETAGFVIELEHGGNSFDYRSDMLRVVHCDK